MSDHLKDCAEYDKHTNKMAKESGFVFTPFPPAPVKDSPSYEKDVDTFINAIPLFVKQVNHGRD